MAVEVVDSGPGPPPELAETLCDAFVTSKPEGVGLGLALARQVAADHGGRLSWNRCGRETRFSPGASQEQWRWSEGGWMGRILIVDDEASICWAFRESLGDMGHDVQVAASAEEGLQIAVGEQSGRGRARRPASGDGRLDGDAVRSANGSGGCRSS